jgi:UDP:flavonoid glycosyltransferase YjiC (YdhE family)
VLLVGDERNLPENLPADTIAIDYVRYQDLMPRACAVVHHGGVGTTSHGLIAGVPTLIVPFAFDQLDNADHARRIGTSRTLYRKKYNASSAARELNVLLSDNSYTQRARYVSDKLRRENGARRAADLIEEVLLAKRIDTEEPVYAFGN